MTEPDTAPPANRAGGASPALSPPVLALACAALVALLVWASGWLHFDDPADDAPVSNRPIFVGEVTPSATAVALTLLPTGQRWTAPVDPTTGAFEVVFPDPLPSGSYALYVDDALGREFVVAPDQP